MRYADQASGATVVYPGTCEDPRDPLEEGPYDPRFENWSPRRGSREQGRAPFRAVGAGATCIQGTFSHCMHTSVYQDGLHCTEYIAHVDFH